MTDYEAECMAARDDYDAAVRNVESIASFAVSEAFIAAAPGLQLALDIVSDRTRPASSERLRLIARDATERWLSETLTAIVDALASSERGQHDGAERLRQRTELLKNAYDRIVRYVPVRCSRDAKKVILCDTQTGCFVCATPKRETTKFVEYDVGYRDGGTVRLPKGKDGRYVVWSR